MHLEDDDTREEDRAPRLRGRKHGDDVSSAAHEGGTPKHPAIVVGTDFSSACADALARAADIARETNAALHVVHASRRLPKALARTLGIRDERFVTRALTELGSQLGGRGRRVHTHHVHGGAARALGSTCREVHAGLVVVGTRGRTVPNATIGSTAERIVSTERTPVLLVRRKSHERYREVVIAADVDTNVGPAAAAARLAAPGARVSLLHAFATPYESSLVLQGSGAADLRIYRTQARQAAREAMKQLLVQSGLSDTSLALQHGDARRVLGNVDAKALLVIVRGRSLLRHAFLGSVSRWIIAYGKSDVLLV